ncbi:PadR family transcriptional regulator [Robertmurraya yapensis]|uniref:PadR family transcriptional regulator n=2 Tax=Bacillaceae TaxID=186817 RepID=A0A431VY17_9BACI|nr:MULTISPECIES: PadR family transcriptional regulator [Bacillaceae]RTR28187.1 PadR family transcriptional regulator [Bacillus yapensis]TKC15114.1 PadR family transcriptional regulator [Robertmurraya kyonggiensis]TKS94431.1 PadR family transcriptional regulator [Bacillus yapensis]
MSEEPRETKHKNPKKFALNMTASQFTKFYILHLLHKRPTMIAEEFKQEFKTISRNWQPAPSTLLNALHEMSDELGLLTKRKEIRGTRQVVYNYSISLKGEEEFEILKKKYKILFDEQKATIDRILREVYK